ncbi:MAG: hypothetical protein EKK53_23070 [Burkholderiales bacterium]|nr:MAG: hypothetical protein EKK53_23070 [Burkholderiales bacterium]
MLGAPLSPSFSSFTAPGVRPLGAAAPGQPADARTWLDGLALPGGPALRADVAAEQRGLSAQQHAERVLSALLG